MTFSEFEKKLNKDSLSSLYLIHGEEVFYVEKALNSIKEKAKETGRELVSLNGDECEAGEILNAAGSGALFGGKSLIIVKNVLDIKAREKERLLKYFPNWPKGNVTVFTGMGKADRREKFYASFKNYGEEAVFNHPDARECPVWLKERAKSLGFNISGDAVKFLADSSGKDLQILDNELNKIITYMGEKRSIALADVEAVLGRNPIHTIFNLTDALGAKNIKSALTYLNQLLGEDNHPLMIHTMITRQIRTIAELKSLLNQGVPSGEAVKRMGLAPFLQKNLLDQAANFSADQLEAAFKNLLQIDILLKSSPPAYHRIFLESFCVNLCGGK